LGQKHTEIVTKKAQAAIKKQKPERAPAAQRALHHPPQRPDVASG
jgi:hypothetical protein